MHQLPENYSTEYLKYRLYYKVSKFYSPFRLISSYMKAGIYTLNNGFLFIFSHSVNIYWIQLCSWDTDVGRNFPLCPQINVLANNSYLASPPVQETPFPTKPVEQLHIHEPTVSMQVAFEWQLLPSLPHSLMSQV